MLKLKNEINIEAFLACCQNKNCLRHTMITKNCEKESKQWICFIKYKTKLKKDINKLNLKLEQTKIKKEQEKKDAIEQSTKDWQIRSIKKELGIEESIEYEIDQRYETFKKNVWEHYIGFYDQNVSDRKDWKDICMFWKCLTEEEKNIIYNNDAENLWINKSVDIAHVLSRSERPDLIYDISNVFLIGRLWHGRIDKYKDPITNESINQEQRMKWFERIKKG